MVMFSKGAMLKFFKQLPIVEAEVAYQNGNAHYDVSDDEGLVKHG